MHAFSLFLRSPTAVSVLFWEIVEKKMGGKEWERERGQDTDPCGLCTAAVCIVVIVFSYAFRSFFCRRDR
jgi:hypothetical protein